MKTITVLLLFLLCINLNAQKGKLYLSSWNPGGETDPAGYSYDKKSKLFYQMSNDENNIYIGIRVEDSGVQGRILKQGLTVWVNMNNKSVKNTGIRFPIGSQYSGSRGRQDMPGSSLNPDGTLITPLSLANTIELVGFTGEEARRFPAVNSNTFSGSVKYNEEGILFYKMKIPIEKLPVRNSKDGEGAAPFTIGIEYGAPPSIAGPAGAAAPRSGSGSMPSGSSGGSYRGRRGGGAPGGGNPSSGSALAQGATPVMFWIKEFKLASGR